MLDHADHRVGAVGLFNTEAELAVVQQYRLTSLDVRGEFLVARPGHFRVAGALSDLDGQLGAVDQLRAVFHHADPKLGALHVGQERRVGAQFGVHRLDPFHRGGMGLVIPVGEIESDHIDPFPNEALEDLRRCARRANGRDDFGEFLRHGVLVQCGVHS